MRAGTLAAAFAHYGVDIPKGYREVSVCCPVHGESRASMTVNLEEGVFFCFACQAKGNALSLVTAMESMDLPAAQEKLDAILRAAGIESNRTGRSRYQRPGEGRSAAPGRKYVPPGRRNA